MSLTAQKFEQRYQAWLAFIQSDTMLLVSSDDLYTQNPYFTAIVELGTEAVPFLIEKLRTDTEAHFLIHALANITNRQFSAEELAAARAAYGEVLGNQAFAELWVRWWDEQQAKNRG